MRIALITLAAGRRRQLLTQREGVRRSPRRPDRYVVVSMGDAAITPSLLAGDPPADLLRLPLQRGRLPLARARNLGAEHAIARGAQLLVFLDADCIPDPQLLSRYEAAAQDQSAPCLLCGPVSYLSPAPPGGYPLRELRALGRGHAARPVPSDNQIIAGDPRLFWSLSFAVTTETWTRVGGFCTEYEGYGGEDTDFAQLACAAGATLLWVGGAWAFHQYHPRAEPPVEHLDDILENARRFQRRWGWWPMIGWLEAFEEMGLANYDPHRQQWARSVCLGAAGGCSSHPPAVLTSVCVLSPGDALSASFRGLRCCPDGDPKAI